jgi:hypothetical protein
MFQIPQPPDGRFDHLFPADSFAGGHHCRQRLDILEFSQRITGPIDDVRALMGQSRPNSNS